MKVRRWVVVILCIGVLATVICFGVPLCSFITRPLPAKPSLDLTLKELDLSYYRLRELDVSANKGLRALICDGNRLMAVTCCTT